MIFYIDPNIFDTKDDSLGRLLDKFFHNVVYDDVHDWYLPIGDEDRIMDSKWLEDIGERNGNYILDLIKKTLKKSSYSTGAININILKTLGQNPSTNEYTLQEALDCLQEKLYIILEGHSDEYFLEALFKKFSNTKKINRLRKKRWLYHSAGGKNNIITAIDKLLLGARWWHLCLFVVMDSDKTEPMAAMPPTQQDIEAKCKDSGIQYHILYKREIENYLPEEVLTDIPDNLQEVCKAYIALSPEQKDFYDLEKGFQDKKQPHDNQKALFKNLSEESIHKLRKGFNRNDFISKQKLPTFFAYETITQQNLKNRCAHQPNPNELQEIVDKIDSLL